MRVECSALSSDIGDTKGLLFQSDDAYGIMAPATTSEGLLDSQQTNRKVPPLLLLENFKLFLTLTNHYSVGRREGISYKTLFMTRRHKEVVKASKSL